MIAGYSQNKRERESMELYAEMLDAGVFPDEFTLGSVVRACSALADEGLGRQLHCHVVKSDKGLTGSSRMRWFLCTPSQAELQRHPLCS